jgi:ABC-type transporter Mla maintaining outer membrane lipid asymmetry permease subunit MlaE
MRKVMTAVLVMGLLLGGIASAANETGIQGGTIPGVASVGVEVPTFWENLKSHVGSNWGKYTLGVITAIIGGLIYVNNNGFKGNGDGDTTVHTTATTRVNDESINVSVADSYNNQINVYANRGEDSRMNE